MPESRWEVIQCENTVPISSADVQVDNSQLPLINDEEGRQVMRFYWLDAHEDPYKQPGK